MRGAGMLLIVIGLLLVYLTYTKSTGAFIGAIVNAQPG